MRKKQSSRSRRLFIATWTRSQVYTFQAMHFQHACELALADRTLYTPHTLEKLTIRELLKKETT